MSQHIGQVLGESVLNYEGMVQVDAAAAQAAAQAHLQERARLEAETLPLMLEVRCAPSPKTSA